MDIVRLINQEDVSAELTSGTKIAEIGSTPIYCPDSSGKQEKITATGVLKGTGSAVVAATSSDSFPGTSAKAVGDED